MESKKIRKVILIIRIIFSIPLLIILLYLIQIANLISEISSLPIILSYILLTSIAIFIFLSSYLPEFISYKFIKKDKTKLIILISSLVINILIALYILQIMLIQAEF